MPDHTVKAFDADEANLARMITEMHEQVEKGLQDAVEALIRNDDKLGKAVLVLDESTAVMSSRHRSKCNSVHNTTAAGRTRSTLRHCDMGNSDRA